MKKPRSLLAVLFGFAIGIAVTLGAARIIPMVRDYFGPPHVTLMNACGEDISDITISLGQAKRDLPELKYQHAITVPIHGQFSECSTHVDWTDSDGQHSESAGGYMEAYGFYHAEVVITPDKKAVSVYNITKSNKTLHSDAVNRARER